MKNISSFSKTLAVLAVMIVAIVGFGYATSSAKAENVVIPAAVSFAKSPSAKLRSNNHFVSQNTGRFNLIAAFEGDQEMLPCEDKDLSIDDSLNFPAIISAKYSEKFSPPRTRSGYDRYDDSPILYQPFNKLSGIRNRHIVRRE